MENKILVQFRKISSNHSRLRDDLIVGFTHSLPEEGRQFIMYSNSRDLIDKDALRVVNTSIVKKITKKIDSYILETVSGSIYEVKILQ